MSKGSSPPGQANAATADQLFPRHGDDQGGIFGRPEKIGKRAERPQEAAPEESGTVSSIRDFARKDSRRWRVKGVCSNRSEKFSFFGKSRIWKGRVLLRQPKW